MKITPTTSPGNAPSCTHFLDYLKAYHDGELPLRERLPIRLHLFRCSACREEIQLMEKITNELQTADSAVLDPSLRSRLLDGIPASATAEPEKKRFRFHNRDLTEWKKKPRMIWAAAAIACILVFVFQVSPKLMDHQLMSSNQVAAHNFSSPAPAAAVENQVAMKAQSDLSSSSAMPMSGTPSLVDAEKLKSFTSKGTGRSMVMNGKLPSSQLTEVPVSKRRVMMGGKARMGASPVFLPSSPAPMFAQLQRQVHREASLTLEVDRLEETSGTIEDMIKATGGYIATNELTSADDGTKSASLVAKVPVNQFDEIMGKLSKLGSVKAKSVNGEDLTEKISDSHQEEKSLNQQIEESKQRLAHLKGNGARRDEAENIRDLRVQEAQAEGRLELLKKMARLSTISIELHEKSKTQIAPQQSGFVTDMKENAQAALQSFMQAAKLPIMLVIWLAAYAPIWIVLVVTYKYIVRA